MTDTEVISEQTVEQSRPRRRWSWLLLAVPLLAASTGLSIAYAHGFGRGDRGAPGQFMQGHMLRMLDTAGASESQKAQIKTIWDGLRPQLKALHQQGAEVRHQIEAALAAPKIDTAAIEKLRVQSVQLMDKGSELATHGMIASAQVLTAAQRQKIVEEVRNHHRDRGPGDRGPKEKK